MFGMSGTELLIVLVVALLLFGPDKLPEMAKMAGKAMREFQRATGDIRSTVETEFNKLADTDPQPKKSPAGRAPANVVKLEPAPGAVASESRIAPPNLIVDAPAQPVAVADPVAEPVPELAPSAPEAEKPQP